MNDFEKLNLKKSILDLLSKKGFKAPTLVQKKAIPQILRKENVVVQSRTGSGKTLSYLLPLFHLLDPKKSIQGLIIVPTRELAKQVYKEALKFKQLDFTINLVIGGIPISREKKKLEKKTQLIIATTGRLIQHLQERSIRLSTLKYLVIDEADMLFDMGFLPDVKFILENSPKDKKVWMFSATFPYDILQLIDDQLQNYTEINVSSNYLYSLYVDQYRIDVAEDEKPNLLLKLLGENYTSNKLSMVFCRTRSKVEFVNDFLQSNDIKSGYLHGGLDQEKRNAIVSKATKGLIKVLVCTDVASRGLDFDNVNCVYNYDLSKIPDDYVHRIGRTGRAETEGKSYIFVTPTDAYLLLRIINFCKPDLELIKYDKSSVSIDLDKVEQDIKLKKFELADKFEEKLNKQREDKNNDNLEITTSVHSRFSKKMPSNLNKIDTDKLTDKEYRKIRLKIQTKNRKKAKKRYYQRKKLKQFYNN